MDGPKTKREPLRLGSRLAGNRFSRASALPCQSFEGKRTIVNEDEPRMDTKTDEPPSGTGGTKMLLRYCVLGVTMSWDECPLGARASRPHKARHSLGHLPLLVSFFVALHGPLSSLFQPLKVPSRTPFPTFGGSLLSLLQPLRGPSWISFCLFVEILSPLGAPRRIPLEPSPTPSWPFGVLRELRG